MVFKREEYIELVLRVLTVVLCVNIQNRVFKISFPMLGDCVNQAIVCSERNLHIQFYYKFMPLQKSPDFGLRILCCQHHTNFDKKTGFFSYNNLLVIPQTSRFYDLLWNRCCLDFELTPII